MDASYIAVIVDEALIKHPDIAESRWGGFNDLGQHPDRQNKVFFRFRGDDEWHMFSVSETSNVEPPDTGGEP